MEIGDKGNGGRKGEEWNGPHTGRPGLGILLVLGGFFDDDAVAM